MKITQLAAEEILDSRGIPTLFCRLELEDGRAVEASVPSGTSVGSYEAKEVRDADSHHGMRKALKGLSEEIAPLIIGKEPEIYELDALMKAVDGTPNKGRLGANTLLVVSIAVARAEALCKKQPLYQLVADYAGTSPAIPLPMCNLINGGLHAQGALVFQEYMVLPAGNRPLSTIIDEVMLLYKTVGELIAAQAMGGGSGLEGGYSLKGGIADPEIYALDLLAQAVRHTQTDYLLALDVAANSFFDAQRALYMFHGKEYTAGQLIAFYKDVAGRYRLYSIEDGLAQDDWAGWQQLCIQLKDRTHIIGDDLFATNPQRINEGMRCAAATGVILKPNQIGTVSEAIEVAKIAKKAGFLTVVSHRSGETLDTFIADFAVGIAADHIKTGPYVQPERIAKYHRLLEIEKTLLGRF